MDFDDSIRKHFGHELAEAKAKCIAATTAKIVKNLIRTGKMSLDEIANTMEIPLAEIQKIANSL